jgi:hypothetical protein
MKFAIMRDIRGGAVLKIGSLIVATFAIAGVLGPIASAGPGDQCYMPNPPPSCYGGGGGSGGGGGQGGGNNATQPGRGGGGQSGGGGGMFGPR